MVSADRIRRQVLETKPQTAVVVSSGFIGLEMAENLTARGIRVSVVEVAEHVMPALDADMAVYVADYLTEQGVEVITQDAVTRLEEAPLVSKVVLKSGRELAADLVILAAGVRPKSQNWPAGRASRWGPPALSGSMSGYKRILPISMPAATLYRKVTRC